MIFNSIDTVYLIAISACASVVLSIGMCLTMPKTKKA
jgi:hypothetical protein